MSSLGIATQQLSTLGIPSPINYQHKVMLINKTVKIDEMIKQLSGACSSIVE
jgi:hypothetical protein